MAMLVLADTCAALVPPVRIPLNPSLLTESGAVCDPAGMQTCLMAQAFDASVPSHEKWSRKRNGAMLGAGLSAVRGFQFACITVKSRGGLAEQKPYCDFVAL